MSVSGSRAATVPLIGGRPCLNLVNSVSWRGGPAERHEDHLRTPEDCLVWCVRAGVLTGSEADRLRGTAGTAFVASLRRLRERIASQLADSVELDPVALGAAIREAIAHSQLVPAGDSARWAVVELDQQTPARRIALDLYDQLTRPRGRIGRCDDRDCGWVFVDTSRAGSRRWCSSDDCGNRHRVRRHQARQRARRPG